MAPLISLVIPNRNGEATIGKCLEAAFSSSYTHFEVIVVDDCSNDRSIEIIKRYPCTLVRLEKHSGASTARNAGARSGKGDTLFFTDADCLLQRDTLSIVSRTVADEGPDVVVGGTYTRVPHDKRFFSVFQSVFISYSETKRPDRPDYIATHAMAIDARAFRAANGFAEDFLPILEDVEFSHRLRMAGYKLVMNPDLQVRHIFNYSLFGSLRNALRKSLYWTVYSLGNRDLLSDSGAASIELKINVGTYFLGALFLLIALLTGNPLYLSLMVLGVALSLLVNRGLFRAMYRTGGFAFASAAAAYYVMVYPLPVGAGALAGVLRYLGAPRRPRLD